MDRLLYATPTGGHPNPHYVQSMRAVEMSVRSFGERRFQDFAMTTGPVQYARTKIVNKSMEGRCFIDHAHDPEKPGDTCRVKAYDYLLQHDDDLAVSATVAGQNPLDAWHEMFRQRSDVGVIAAVYMREAPRLPNVVVPHPDLPGEVVQVVSGMPLGYVEVAGIATGFMMVRKEVFQEIGNREIGDGPLPAFRFEYARQLASGFHVEEGEDYDFCRRVRAAGFKVMADTRVRTLHCKESGLLEYAQEDWEAQWAAKDPKTGEVTEAAMGVVAANVKMLEQQLAPGIKPVEITVSGCKMIVLDHAEAREREVQEWRDKLASRTARAAKAA